MTDKNSINSALKFMDSKLASLLEGQDNESLRRIAVESAAQAIKGTEVESSVAFEALEAAKSGTYGNDELSRKLEALAAKIEDPYLKALDKDQNVESNATLMKLFAQARAVTALELALYDEATFNAGNAIYEALYAGVTSEAVQKLLK